MKKKLLGLTIIVVAILCSILLTIDPNILIKDGEPLDSGFLLSKVITASLSIFLLAKIGVIVGKD